MATPAKRKAESPAAEPPAASVPKTTTPTPDPVSPAHKSPTPGSPAVASESHDPAGVLSGEYWLQQGLPESDIDSTLGSDDESSTTSIASSILHYRTINGRTYHSDAATDK